MLFVVRHGDYDDDENLTDWGERQANSMGQIIEERASGSVVMLVSPATRAQQFAVIIARVLGLEEEKLITDESFRPDPPYSELKEMIEAINGRDEDCVIVVTHGGTSDVLPRKFAREFEDKEIPSILPALDCGCAYVVDVETGILEYV